MTDAGDQSLTIGVFARRSRLSPKALRLYEANGVLVPARVDEHSGYRRYDESQLSDARFIRMLRRIDMPLAQVATVLGAPRAERDSLIREYWTAVEARHIRQRALALLLDSTLSVGKDDYPMAEITIREIPEQLVLTEQAHVTAERLPQWIGQALWRQHEHLAAVGGPAGAPIVVYHGEVTEDSDGPVEACTPVDPARAAELGSPTRIEPAHREAYVTITKAQVRYPDILAAYDAVESWIGRNGHTIIGSPREVYFAEFETADADDPVIDIAFVIAGD